MSSPTRPPPVEWKNGIGTVVGTNVKFKYSEEGQLVVLSSDSKCEGGDSDASSCTDSSSSAAGISQIDKSRTEDEATSSVVDEKVVVKLEPATAMSCSPPPLLSTGIKVVSPESVPQKRKRLEDVIKEIDRKHLCVPIKSPTSPTSQADIILQSDPFIRVVWNFKNSFESGQRLETIDPRNPIRFCAASVTGVRGHRVKIHVDGQPSALDFWTNCYSPFIKPVGYSRSNEKIFVPPKSFDSSVFLWSGYLQMIKSIAAPENCFYKQPPAKYPVKSFGVDSGMRVDAVHPGLAKNAKVETEAVPSFGEFSNAVIRNTLDDRYVLVHLDSSGSSRLEEDFYVELDSPFIRKRTSIIGVPEAAFHKRAPITFQVGRPIECVDPSDSSWIRRAHVVQCAMNRVLVRTEAAGQGNTSKLIWFPEDSWDIYPAGFCAQAGYHIRQHKVGKSLAALPSSKTENNFATSWMHALDLRPKPPVSVSAEASDDPVTSSKDDSQRKESKPAARLSDAESSEASESNTADPYEALDAEAEEASPEPADDDDDEEDGENAEDADDVSERNEVVAGGEPRRKKKRKKYFLSKPPKGHRVASVAAVSNNSKSILGTKPIGKSGSDQDSFDHLQDPIQNAALSVNGHRSNLYVSHLAPLQIIDVSPAWDKIIPRQLMPRLNVGIEEIRKWDVERVAEFIRSLPGCTPEHGRTFKEEQIDGEAFLLLSQNDIAELLHIKLGPALKIYSCVEYFNKLKPLEETPDDPFY